MPARGRKQKIDNGPTLQLPIFEMDSAWRPPSLGDLPQWPEHGRVSVDIETRDPHLKELGPGCRRDDGFVSGYSFAIDEGPSFYVPVRHQGGDNVGDAGLAFDYLRDQAKRFKGILVGANLGYDTDWLSTAEDVNFLTGQCSFRDVQIADPLINELHFSYSLDAIAKRWGFDGKDEALLKEAAREYNVDPKIGLWKLPARFVGPYATADADLPLKILKLQEAEIEAQGLWNVFNLECAVQRVLILMRQRGVLVDQDRLSKVERWTLVEESKALKEIAHHTGIKLNRGDVWKAGAVAKPLEYIGVKLGKTAKGAPNIDKVVLEGIHHPVADAILHARKVNKLRTTFAASIRRHQVAGRIHCTYNQLRKTDEEGNEGGAAYGRLSCENPNLQQQPARDEFAAMWRAIYIPEDGAIFGSNDFSQQEPRMLVHFAELINLSGADTAGERYRTDPSTDSHQMFADMAGVPRKAAKNIYLGITYGMGGAKLCRSLGLPTRWACFIRKQGLKYFANKGEAMEYARQFDLRAFETAGEEGQRLLDAVNTRAPFLKGMAKKAEEAAKQKGYIITLSGRRCRFPTKPSGAYDWTHKALNRLIQGSSADQTKAAVVACEEAGHFIQLQVHDEICGSFESVEQAKESADIMANVYDLKVPFKVDTEVGPSWGECVELAA